MLHLLLLALAWRGTRVVAHPQCIEDQTYTTDVMYGVDDYRKTTDEFCTLERMGGDKLAINDGTCCTKTRDVQIRAIYEADIRLDGVDVDPECRAKHRRILCSECHPFSGHLYKPNKNLLQVDFQDFWGGGTPSGDLPPIAMPKLAMPNQVMQLRMVPGKNAWWSVGKAGLVYEFVNSDTTTTKRLVLDIQNKVYLANSEGMFDVAFNPNFATNKIFYAFYSFLASGNSWTRLSQFKYIDGQPAQTSSTEKQLLNIKQTRTVHKAGAIVTHEGQLYLSLGDGGGENDPERQAQDGASLLGKVLRMKVSDAGVVTGTGFGGPNNLIFAKGFRNPHKMTIDPATDELWIGDVGQASREEVSVLKTTSGNLKNFGWPMWEGFRCNVDYAGGGCNLAWTAVTAPLFDYCHQGIGMGAKDKKPCPAFTGDCVIGGVVYRGKQYPKLFGHYIFTDYGTGKAYVMTVDRTSGAPVAKGVQELMQAGKRPASLAVDSAGEVYFVDHIDTNPAVIYRLADCGIFCQ